eukprot:g1377.t1
MDDRIVCHFDVDSFYCACECIRRPELKNKPFAVTQFNSGGFVSVNHTARLAGVRKGDGIGAGGQKALDHFKNRPEALMGEVLKRCPDLLVLKMDTIWYRKVSSDIENALKLALKKICEKTMPLSILSSSSSSSFPTLLSSAQPFSPKTRATDIHSNKLGVVEKSSIDDFFVDITKIVFGYLMHNCDSTTSNNFSDTSDTNYRESCNNLRQGLSIGDGTFVYEYDAGDRRLRRVQNQQAFSRLPIHLQYAAEVATQIRSYVEEMIGVTLSGGISKNKLISRLISKIARKKNVQTLIENKNINYLLKITPIKSVSGLKGQFGNRLITDFNVESLCDLQKIKFNKLEQMYGKTKANLIYEYSRGIDSSRVAERPPIKSLLSEQSFAPIDNVTQNRLLQRKVKEIVALFMDRLLLLENRIPTNFTVKFRHLYNQQLFLPLRQFPKTKTNTEVVDVPVELVRFHSILKRKHFKTLDLLKKWHKNVKRSDDLLHVQGKWEKKLNSSLITNGFDFKLKCKRLNIEANIHPSFRSSSYAPKDENGKDFLNYERLETLGDSVLGYCLATLLVCTFKRNTSYLHFVLQALSRNKILASINRKFNMYGFLQHVDLPKDINSPGLKDKILADHVEAWIGAKYLDTNLSETRASVAFMFAQCTSDELHACFEDLETEEHTISFSPELSEYIVNVVQSWSTDKYDAVALKKKIGTQHKEFVSSLLNTHSRIVNFQHDDGIFKQYIYRLSQQLPESSEFDLNRVYSIIFSILTSSKRPHTLTIWGNQLLKFVTVNFAFHKKYKFLNVSEKYDKKFAPGDIHCFGKLFRFTKFLDSSAKLVFEEEILNCIYQIIKGIKDVPKNPETSCKEVERGRFADSILRKHFYVFGALLDVFHTDHVDSECSKQFFQDVVIERMLDRYQYLRVDLSPRNLKKAYNDIIREAYPNNNRIIDLEVDQLRHLDLFLRDKNGNFA